MPKHTEKPLVFDWREIAVTDDDWGREPRGFQLLQLYTIRRFEEMLLVLKGRNLVNGPVHSSVGQEAVAVGAIAALKAGDKISGTHRAHHHFLARAMTAVCAEGFDPLADDLPDGLQNVVNRTMAEVMGLAPGWCGGRGGSMHLYAPELGILGTSAIVGGGIAIATGAAWAEKYRGTSNIVVAFQGDGAMNQGIFHEAVNLGGLWEAPIIYLIENNGFAVATSVEEAAHLHAGLLSQRAAAYDLPAFVVDGMNPIAVQAAVAEAADSIRQGGHPVVVEALTYRLFHHAGDLPGYAFGYRDKTDEAPWRERDPIIQFGRELVEREILSAHEERGLLKLAEGLVAGAVEFCTLGGTEARPELLPKADTVTRGIRSDGHEFSGAEFAADGFSAAGILSCRESTAAARSERIPTARPSREMSYVEAIAAVTGRQMETDDRVFVMGEEVGHMGGGAYKATKGLSEIYPGRVLDTPISEGGFSGFGCGAAMAGLRPIVEIMFPDFVLVAADQVLNHIGKLRHIYGGKASIPIVFRTRCAIGLGYGGQHSMDSVALFALFPGWRIVAPVTPYDYIGMFNSAMRCEDPVLVFEHASLYDLRGEVPKGDLDYLLPLDKARVVKTGEKVTVLAYSAMVTRIEKLVEGDDAVELIDLRALDFASMDFDAIGASVQKTGAIVIADESTRSCSIGAMIADECQRRFFDCLDAPILRISGADAPKAVSRALELAAIPSDNEILAVISRAARREG